ncbi:MAG: hypothetical protein V1898_04310 [Patescibacteria group bacterium]
MSNPNLKSMAFEKAAVEHRKGNNTEQFATKIQTWRENGVERGRLNNGDEVSLRDFTPNDIQHIKALMKAEHDREMKTGLFEAGAIDRVDTAEENLHGDDAFTDAEMDLVADLLHEYPDEVFMVMSETINDETPVEKNSGNGYYFMVSENCLHELKDAFTGQEKVNGYEIVEIKQVIEGRETTLGFTAKKQGVELHFMECEVKKQPVTLEKNNKYQAEKSDEIERGVEEQEPYDIAV